MRLMFESILIARAGAALRIGWTVLPAAKIAIALTRISQGNFSNVNGVGSGVLEYRLDFGPGYRIYLGKDGEQLIIRERSVNSLLSGAAFGGKLLVWDKRTKKQATRV